MPVGEMLRRMDSAEITEWMAFYAIRNEKPDQAVHSDDPEEMSKMLKAALFKKKD